MKTTEEIIEPQLSQEGTFTVALKSVGNPDRGQDPNASLPGVKNVVLGAKSLLEASELCEKYIALNELGGGNWAGGQVMSQGKQVARVSYNGRVWHV